MTKQEEIREGIASLLRPWMGDPEGSADDVLSYLHSQRCRIEVGEISDDLATTASQPKTFYAPGIGLSWERSAPIFEEFKKAGYVMTIPIKEVVNGNDYWKGEQG